MFVTKSLSGVKEKLVSQLFILLNKPMSESMKRKQFAVIHELVTTCVATQALSSRYIEHASV